MNLFFIFLTGLTTGGLSCLAMQGGLLASVIANQKKQEGSEEKTETEKKNQAFSSFDQLDWLPVLMFLSTKLVAHTVLGFFLGLLGSAVTLSLGMQLTFQAFAALFMFATAMNLLNAHPVFRYVSFQPPKFLQRYVRNTSKSRALFAPALLGLLTVFIPCGVTQAMEVLAINSGSPIQGALIMFVFVLGTSPIFAALGISTAKLSEGLRAQFSKIAAAILILMAAYSLNGVLTALDSPLAVQRVLAPVASVFAGPSAILPQTNQDGVQQITIQVLNTGYSPKKLRVQSGVPVELTLQSNETYSCALSFVFKEFGIKTFLDSTDSQTFTFTPQKPGIYHFSCSMGMYTGVLEVI